MKTLSATLRSTVCTASVVLVSSVLSAQDTKLLYQQSSAPIERRLDDLLGRMTLEEKARQLDLYSGAKDLVSAHSDDTHATADAVFVPEKAEKLFGTLGVGGIHDLYPTAEQSNAVQRWVIVHSRLGIPALFIEEALHGFNTGTVFPSPLNLASAWDEQLAHTTGASIAAEARSTGVDMILAPVLDLARDPRWVRIEEDFGEDTFLTGRMGLAYVQGAQGDSLNTDHTLIAEPTFKRIHLEPNETRTVALRVPQRQLAVWNAERKWAVEPGSYAVWVGGSSQAQLATSFVLAP